MSQKIDINNQYIGQKFGKLTVIKLVSGNNATNRKYLCKCDCGNEKIHQRIIYGEDTVNRVVVYIKIMAVSKKR